MLTAISSSTKSLTFQILGTLPLLTGLADNLDGSTREDANDTLRLVVGGRSSDLDQCLDLLFLLVDIRDEQLLADAAANVGSARRGVGDVKGLASRASPLNRTFLRGGLSGDGDDDAWWAEFRLLAAAMNIRPP